MNSTRIFVMDAICSAHIPVEFSRSGALGRGRVGSLLMSQSTVRKKMTTGTLTYNALRTKTLKDSIKTQRKIVTHLNSTRTILLVQERLLLNTERSYKRQ